VDDLCDLVAEQVDSPDRWNGWVGNVSGGASNASSLCELTALCRDETGNDTEIRSVPETRPGDLRIYIGDCSRLFERTPWRPQRNVRMIVRDTADWASRHATSLQAGVL
jgi:CDP-paratose 2-epimerase